MSIYENIKEIAKQKKISINQLEKECEFSAGSICKWNSTSPSVAKVKKVADHLKVNINKLID